MSTGIDFYDARSISSSSIKAHGYDFVGSYLGPSGSRYLSLSTANQFKSAGLAIVSLYETIYDYCHDGYYDPNPAAYYNPNNNRTGYLQNIITYGDGYYQAQRAYTYAVSVAQTPGSAIYFAVDADVLNVEISYALSYFAGIKDGMQAASGGTSAYKIGVYGAGAVLDWVFNNGLADYKWLAAPQGWNGSFNYSSYDIRQLDNDS